MKLDSIFGDWKMSNSEDFDVLETNVSNSTPFEDLDLDVMDSYADEKKEKENDKIPYHRNIIELCYYEGITKDEFKYIYEQMNPTTFLSLNQYYAWKDYGKEGQLTCPHSKTTCLWFAANKDSLLAKMAAYQDFDEQYEDAKEAYAILQNIFWDRNGTLDHYLLAKFLTDQNVHNIDYFGTSLLIHKDKNKLSRIGIQDAILLCKKRIEDYQNKCKDNLFLIALDNKQLRKLWLGLAKKDVLATILALPKIKVEFLQDTKDKIFLPFRNAVIEVTKDKIAQVENSFCYWEQTEIKHDIDLVRMHGKPIGDFAKFLNNITGTNEKAMNLATALGYLISTYNDVSNPAIVIISEENNELGTIKGGTGKSLLIKGLSHVRNLCHISGQRWNPYKGFLFQSVKPETQLVDIDDVKMGFRLDDLNDTLTSGMVIEEKNKAEITRPPSSTPKMVMTTNYPIRGTDDSFIRRRFDVEINRYYNAKHKPLDDFKKAFFSEQWDNQDWQDYYNTILFCCQTFLKLGIVKIDQESLKAKIALADAGTDLSGILDSYLDEFQTLEKEHQENQYYFSSKTLQEDFKVATGRLEGANQLIRRGKEYLKTKGYELISKRERTLQTNAFATSYSFKKIQGENHV